MLDIEQKILFSTYDLKSPAKAGGLTGQVHPPSAGTARLIKHDSM